MIRRYNRLAYLSNVLKAFLFQGSEISNGNHVKKPFMTKKPCLIKSAKKINFELCPKPWSESSLCCNADTFTGFYE